jgi:hypothetical protein
MIVGARSRSDETFALDSDRVYLKEVTLSADAYMYGFNVWFDSMAGGLGPAYLRPVIYSRPGNARIAIGDVVTVLAGVTGDYFMLTFGTPPLLLAGTYAIGFQVGGTTHTLSAAYDEAARPSVRSGSLRITSPGPPVALASTDRPVEQLVVVARDANVAQVAVGSSSIDVTGTQVSRRLSPGDRQRFGEVDMADVFIDASFANDGVAWIAREFTSAGLHMDSSYASGAPGTLVPVTDSFGMALYATPTTLESFDTSVLTEEYMAGLPWPESQQIFSSQGALANSGRLAAASWYGTDFDPNIGAFAIVREGGVLEALLGERIKVSFGSRAIWLYVTDSGDTDEDIAMPRMAFERLAPPALDAIDVLVEVVSG